MHWLNYHHLYYFWTIAKEDGVTKACKKLRLSQPTLSSQLRQFEDVLGKPLFERKSRKLVLNETGRIVFDYADQIFKMGEQLLSSLEESSEKEQITLQVGVLSTLPKKDIYDFLQTPLHQGHVRLVLHVASMEELLVELMNHNIDAIISNTKAPTDLKGVFNYHLDRVPVIIAGSKDFKDLRRGFPKSLNHQPLFIPGYKSYIRHDIEQFFKDKNIHPKIRGEVQDSEFLRVLAASGEGLVTIERSAISDLIKSKELVSIADDIGIYEDYYLIASKASSDHPMIKKIVKKYT